MIGALFGYGIVGSRDSAEVSVDLKREFLGHGLRSKEFLKIEQVQEIQR